MLRNPVMFVTEIGSVLTTVLWLQALSGQAGQEVAKPLEDRSPNRLEGLTERQRAVAEMVGQGANNKQIAYMSALAYTFLWKELGQP